MRSLYSVATTEEFNAFIGSFNTTSDIAYSTEDEYLFSYVRTLLHLSASPRYIAPR